MKKIPKELHLNESLMNALLDPIKEERLRKICLQLKRLGSTKDWEGKPIPWLELVSYGVINCVKFSQIAKVFWRDEDEFL